VESRSVGSARLTELVEDYARRIYPAVLDQHSAASVCSPLGVWLLLAACAPVADGENRHALEGALGCSGDEAHELLSGFLAVPPPALKAAIAVWTSMTDASEAVAAWVRGLPAEVESGYMPTKAEADDWANRKTLGLIKTFPLQIDEMTRVVLASALATKVSWELPFDVTPAGEHLGTDSPWRGAVKRLLWDRAPRPATMIASTSSAGLVAVHPAIAREDLTVISVSADPAVSRDAVLDAAHEIARCARGAESPARSCSLFELTIGRGHSWEIAERERITDVSLPAWHIEGTLDLRASPRFGAQPALDVTRDMIRPRPGDQFDAVQAAVASYTRYGFEAAAITSFGVAGAARRLPTETGVERTASFRFDHPYAVVAIAGRPGEDHDDASSALAGLPLFSAWVAAPDEADEEPPGG
jgi:hypothetical protein